MEKLLAESGLTDVKGTILRAPLTFATASDALQFLREAGAYRAVVADLSAAEKSDAWNEVGGFLQQMESSTGFKTELEIKITSGPSLNQGVRPSSV